MAVFSAQNHSLFGMKPEFALEKLLQNLAMYFPQHSTFITKEGHPIDFPIQQCKKSS